MIPTLYEATATSFNDNGLGALPELYDAEVVEKANDILELTATYPVSGQRYDDLIEDAIILAKPNSRDDEHAFRISDLELDITGENVAITAYSITNDLGGNLITDLVISDADGQTAMTNLQNAVQSDTHFKFASDITTKSSTHFQMVSPLEAIAGTTGSLLQIWGGEIKRENDQISLLARRGYDDVTTFRLGKNISGLKYAVDTSSVVTRIYPYCSKTVDGGTSLIRGATVDSKYIGNYPYVHIKPVDVSQEITVTEDMTDEQIVAAIDSWAKDWFTKSANTGVDKPSVTISLDVLELSGSSELEGKLATLEQLGLFDTVTLFVPEYNIDVTAKVNELHYDPMARRVTSLVAGTVKTSVFSQQSSALSIVQAAVAEAKNQADYAAVSANGKNTNFFGDAEPFNPKEGDIWYTTELIDGKKEDVIKTFTNGVWTELVTSATGRQIAHDVDAKLVQLNADMSAADENLKSAKQDVADLQVKLKDNDDAQAQLKIDLSDNTELINQVKTDTANSLEKVNNDITKAQSDAAQAVIDADQAAANAKSSADASGLSATSAQAASEAATSAKNLATEVSNNFATVQSQASAAASDAATALDQAKSALATANGVSDNYKSIKQIVDDTSGTIKTLATSESVDAVSGRVTKAQSLAEQTADGLTFKADSSTVDAINDNVKQQGIDLKAAQDELKLKLTQSDLTNGLSGYATQTWAQNQINVTAQGWETQLSSVQAQYNDIGQSQGRNYVRNSRFDSGMDFWINSGAPLTFNVTTDSVAYRGQQGLHMYGTTTTATQGLAKTINVRLSKGQKFVIGLLESFDGFPSQGTLNIGVQFRDKDKNVLGQQWITFYQKVGWNASYNRQSQVYEAPVDCDNLLLMIYAPGFAPAVNVYITEVSLTVGPTSFGWQAAPEDTATYTDTKVADLKLTVDGLSATFAKQTDLEKATSDFKVTSDGLKFITDVTGKNGEKVTQVIADVKNIKTTMTGGNGVTTRLQTLEGFQDTATDNIKSLTTQQTTLADQYNIISGSIINPNLVLNSGFPTDTSSWLDASYLSIGKHPFYRNNRANAFVINNATTSEKTAATNRFKVAPGQSYTVSFKAFASDNSINQDIWFLGRSASSSSEWDNAMLLVEKHRYSPSGVESDKVTFTVPDGIDEGYLRFDNNGSTDGINSVFFFTEIKCELGSLATPWEGESSYAQMTVMQGLIDQRVMVDGKIAAALSLSADGGGTVTIRGASLYVTATSHFDAASIQSAAIAGLAAEKITSGSISSDRLATTKLNADNITSGSIAAARIATTALSATNITSGTLDVGKLTVKNLSADMIASGTIDASKITVTNLSASNIIGGTLDASAMTVKNIDAAAITTGTLNAAGLNVIGLNASAITTGTISGANLAINLNTGMVTFQSGRIHSTTNNIDINVDERYISVADSSNRVILKGGQLQFVQPQLFDLQTTPYLSISNDGVGSNWAGATIIGRDSIMLANSANARSSIYTWEIGKNTFSGLISGKNSDGNWNPTILGGAERGVVIVGGSSTSEISNGSPYIRVGSSLDRKGAGNRIYMRAEYIMAPTIYYHTASGSANVIVKDDGALVRTSSATKYKSNIERFRNTDMGETLLSLPQAHWYNKGDMQRYTDDPQHYSMPELDYGMIAEDLAAAGLEDLVVRGDDGQLEDIRYDRFGPALLPLLAQMKQEIEELKSAAKSA